MRGRATVLSLFCSSLLLLAAGCGLTKQWHEKSLSRYHLSRFEVLARREAFGAAGIEYPASPKVPAECRSEIEPLYREAYDAQTAQDQAWQALPAEWQALRVLALAGSLAWQRRLLGPASRVWRPVAWRVWLVSLLVERPVWQRAQWASPVLRAFEVGRVFARLRASQERPPVSFLERRLSQRWRAIR